MATQPPPMPPPAPSKTIAAEAIPEPRPQPIQPRPLVRRTRPQPAAVRQREKPTSLAALGRSAPRESASAAQRNAADRAATPWNRPGDGVGVRVTDASRSRSRPNAAESAEAGRGRQRRTICKNLHTPMPDVYKTPHGPEPCQAGPRPRRQPGDRGGRPGGAALARGQPKRRRTLDRPPTRGRPRNLGRWPEPRPRRRRGRQRHDRPGALGLSRLGPYPSRRPPRRDGPPRTGISAFRAGRRRQSGRPGRCLRRHVFARHGHLRPERGLRHEPATRGCARASAGQSPTPSPPRILTAAAGAIGPAIPATPANSAGN